MSLRTKTRIHVEDWEPAYGSPYLVDGDDPVEASLVEDGGELRFHRPPEVELADVAHGKLGLAFVDGVRRAEASLYQVSETGQTGRGLVGSHACEVVVAPFDQQLPVVRAAGIEPV